MGRLTLFPGKVAGEVPGGKEVLGNCRCICILEQQGPLEFSLRVHVLSPLLPPFPQSIALHSFLLICLTLPPAPPDQGEIGELLSIRDK